ATRSSITSERRSAGSPDRSRRARTLPESTSRQPAQGSRRPTRSTSPDRHGVGTQRHTLITPRHAVGGRLTIWHVDPASHVPPQNCVPYAPHDGGGPVQPQSPGIGSGAPELPLEPTAGAQTGRPGLQGGSDVVVVVGGQLVAVVPDVVVVVTVQQRPSPAASSCTSFGLHVSRILTAVLNVPSLRGLAHRTAAPAVSPIRSTAPARRTAAELRFACA